MSMASALAPRMGIPTRASDWDKLMAVCPPNWTTDAGGVPSPASFSRMSRRLSSSSGSK